MNDKHTEGLIQTWIRKAEQNGELSQNPFCGKAINPQCGSKVNTQQRHHAINTMASIQTTHKKRA